MSEKHQNTIKEAFLHSSETIDSYVNEVIDASLDYGYFDLPSEPATVPPTSIYYSALPAKSLLRKESPGLAIGG